MRITAAVALLGVLVALVGLGLGLRPLATPTQDCGTAATFLLQGLPNEYVDPSNPPEGITRAEAEANNAEPCQERAGNRALPAGVLVVGGVTLVGVGGAPGGGGVRFRLHRTANREQAGARAAERRTAEVATASGVLRRLEARRHGAAAARLGPPGRLLAAQLGEGSAATHGHSSSAMWRQLAVAPSSPSTAYRPRLIRWMITIDGGTLAVFMISPCGPVVSKKRATVALAYSWVMVRGPSWRTNS